MFAELVNGRGRVLTNCAGWIGFDELGASGLAWFRNADYIRSGLKPQRDCVTDPRAPEAMLSRSVRG